MALLGPGDVLGEACVLDDGPHAVSAVAVADAVLLAVPTQALTTWLVEYPTAVPLLLRVLARRVRCATRRPRRFADQRDRRSAGQQDRLAAVGISPTSAARCGSPCSGQAGQGRRRTRSPPWMASLSVTSLPGPSLPDPSFPEGGRLPATRRSR